MKKKIVLGIVAVIILFVVVMAVWQWNNIVAVVKTFSTTKEELSAELNKTKQELEKELKNKYSTIIEDFSAKEESKILSGELDVDQAVKSLTEKYDKKKEEVKKNQEYKDENSEKIDELIGDKVIELYSLKAFYLGKLGQMEETVKREYVALPKEKKNLIGKQEIVRRHISTATSLLNQCDSRVDSLLKELENELKKLGGDTSIINTIKATYENEKAIKKAYYLKMLNG